MITRYNNIALFKSKTAPSDPNMKDPYYEMSAKENKDSEQKVYPAKLWFKQTESGLNYFSGSMKSQYTSQEGKTYSGYTIVSTDELNSLEAKIKQLEASNIPEGKGYTGEVANTQDIPF